MEEILLYLSLMLGILLGHFGSTTNIKNQDFLKAERFCRNYGGFERIKASDPFNLTIQGEIYCKDKNVKGYL